MNSLRITESDDYRKILVKDDRSGYGLLLNDSVDERSYESVVITYRLRDLLMISTGREIDEYVDSMETYGSPKTDQHFVEVGAGFSALVPEMIEQRGSDFKHKPIVIDPIDYAKAAKLFRETIEQYGDHPVVLSLDSRIEEFARRCDILLGPDVELIQSTLADALHDSQRPIKGVADYVISMYGPARHPDAELGRLCHVTSESGSRIIEGRRKVLERLRMLLRDPTEGILVTEDID